MMSRASWQHVRAKTTESAIPEAHKSPRPPARSRVHCSCGQSSKSHSVVFARQIWENVKKEDASVDNRRHDFRFNIPCTFHVCSHRAQQRGEGFVITRHLLHKKEHGGILWLLMEP